MTRITLSDYAARLEKPKLAEAIGRDVEDALEEGEDVSLDFAGVESITPDFVAALLGPLVAARGIATVAGILDQESMAEAVKTAVMTGLQTVTANPPKAAKPKRKGPPKAERPAPPTPPPPRTPPAPPPPPEEPPPAQPVEDGRRYTPSRLARQLRLQLAAYIESAYPLKHPTLVESRARLMAADGSAPVIAQEPYVETTPRYRSGAPFRQLELPSATRAFFSELADPEKFRREGTKQPLLFDPPYEHQAQAIEKALGKRRDLIVATGTGSGKTESFLLPILGALYAEAHDRPASFELRAVRALVLYPMNALVNDQLSRLRLLVGNEALASRFTQAGGRPAQFGMYTSRTPYAGARDSKKDQDRVKPLIERYLTSWQSIEPQLRSMGKWPAKDLDAFLGQPRQRWAERLQPSPTDRELLTRHEMQRTPPDILVTNYSMLEYMLMRPIERPMFEQTRAWLRDKSNRLILVLDEAHMYRGARGAEVGLLIRRLRARLGIEGRNDQLQVICTSASLGSDEKSKSRIKDFAADLVGKNPADFDVITGARDVAEDAPPGEPALAKALAAVPLDALHERLHEGHEQVAEVLKPVLAALKVKAGPDLDARMFEALRATNLYRRTLARTAGKAGALAELAQDVFPDVPEGRAALEMFLTLGAIARPDPASPGLLPTRLHLFFRGLPGVYACINTRCPGRQQAPGSEAPVGKLFLAPRVHCDAEGCEGRVLELASCRDCGAAYQLAFVEDIESPDFLWPEGTTQTLKQVQLLAERPARDDSDVWQLDVATATGECQPESDDQAVRSFWLATNAEGVRQAEFKRCPVCDGLARKSIVRDLRTKGEQPFTVLVETQFAEQPAQCAATRQLPNAGRKVLVFSDGRQKAARLAPALEYAHLRDTFRQILCLAARRVATELQRASELRLLYPAFLKVVSDRNVALTEELAGDDILATDLRNAENLPLDELVAHGPQPPRSFGALLYQELTDRHHAIMALGLGSVVESAGAWAAMARSRPQLGLSEEETRTLLRIWIRDQLERQAFLPSNTSAYNLGEGEFDDPIGLEPNEPTQWVRKGFREYLAALGLDEDAIEQFAEWVIRNAPVPRLLRLQDSRYYLNDQQLTLELDTTGWSRCTACSRLHRYVLRETCPDCTGSVVPFDEASRADRAHVHFYREQVARALRGDGLEPFGLFAAEHTAQLSAVDDEEAFAKTEEYELRFQDLRIDPEGRAPVVDVLSCTTTMEVGIDIGALTSVALRNVPPQVSNYQQRAGRAGRRGKAVASVLTYAAGGTHDAWFFENPRRIVSGQVEPPVVYVENDVIALRHARAYAVQRFFHDVVPADHQATNVLATLGTIGEFLVDTQHGLSALESWFDAHGAEVEQEIVSWLPTASHWRGEPITVAQRQAIARKAVRDLPAEIRGVLPEFDPNEDLTKLTQEERDQREIVANQELLQTLIEEAVLPRYAFPTSVVSFHVFKPRARRGDRPKFAYQPQRELALALSEYAPGRELTIDKFRFKVSAFYSPYGNAASETIETRCRYLACIGKIPSRREGCGFVSVDPPAPVLMCPVCKGAVEERDSYTPVGFAPNVHAPWRIDRGGTVSTIGRATTASLEVPIEPVADEPWERSLGNGRLQSRHRSGAKLVLVNKGLQNQGFVMCPSCGHAEPVEGPGFNRGQLAGKGAKARKGKPKKEGHEDPIRGGVCTGQPIDPFYMGFRFQTDLLLLRLNFQDPMDARTDERPGLRSALTTLAEALVLACSRVLQIDQGEIEANWSPVAGAERSQVDLYMYDTLAGGAGFALQAHERLEEILRAIREILAEEACTCERSCYLCIRNYSNQVVHAQLDRHLGRALLDYALGGAIPEVAPEAQVGALRSLGHYASLRKNQVSFEHKADGTTVPMRVVAEGGDEIWAGVHHPLLNPELATSPIRDAAGLEVVTKLIDAYDALYRVPEAYQRLMQRS